MGKKASPAVIGGFVVGATVLAVIGVLVFGSGRLFKHTEQFVCFFPGSVDGLNVGAPVRLKGVEIGSVTDIRLRMTEQQMLTKEQVAKGMRIPVTIEIDWDRVAAQGGRHRPVKELIDAGLRAQLNAQSLVTGLLFVQMDFYPEMPPAFTLPPDSREKEIPTIPTTMERVQSAATEIIHKLDEIHFENLVKSVTEIVENVKNILGAPELKQTIERLPVTVANVNQAVTDLRELTGKLDGKTGPLMDSLKGTSDKTGAALEQARATLESVQAFVNPNSQLATQLAMSMQELSGAARSIRLLADYLERNPSAVVRGRDVPEK